MKTLMLLFIFTLTNCALPTWAAEQAMPHDKSMMGGFCPGMEMGKGMQKGMKQKK